MRKKTKHNETQNRKEIKMSAFANAIKKAEVDTKKVTKKSNMPVIADSPDEVKVAVDNVNSAKAELKAAKAKLAKNETVVIDHVRPIQDSNAFNHNHSKSYEVEGVEGSVKYVTSNKFSVSGDDEANLTELLGADGFEKRFEKSESLSVKADIFKDDEKQSLLMELMGDHFHEFFEYKSVLKVKTDFDKMQFELDEEKLADLRVFTQQAKAALK